MARKSISFSMECLQTFFQRNNLVSGTVLCQLADFECSDALNIDRLSRKTQWSP